MKFIDPRPYRKTYQKVTISQKYLQ